MSIYLSPRPKQPGKKGLDFRAGLWLNGIMGEVKKPPRAKPSWLEAEEYFRRVRDGKIPVTLPRVRVPTPPKEEAA